MRSIDDMEGIKMRGHVKNQLQQRMDTVVEESEAKGSFLNSAKSFTMVFSKSEVMPTCKITVHGNTLEDVSKTYDRK